MFLELKALEVDLLANVSIRGIPPDFFGSGSFILFCEKRAILLITNNMVIIILLISCLSKITL